MARAVVLTGFRRSPNIESPYRSRKTTSQSGSYGPGATLGWFGVWARRPKNGPATRTAARNVNFFIDRNSVVRPAPPGQAGFENRVRSSHRPRDRQVDSTQTRASYRQRDHPDDRDDSADHETIGAQ